MKRSGITTSAAHMHSNHHGAGALNVPNTISALRFPLAVVFALVDSVAARVVVLLFAAASDWIDGPLARRTGKTTRAGELLDPIADKTFMLAALGTLALEGRLPWWSLPLLLTRDIGVALGAAFLAVRGARMRMSARRPGKLVTWLQFAGIGVILFWPHSAQWIAPPVCIAGLVALRDYARAARPQRS